MRKILTPSILAATLAVLILCQGAAVGEVRCSGSGVISSIAKSIDYVAPYYETYKSILQEKAPADWERDEITDYLESCGMLIYYAMVWQLASDGYQPLANPQDVASRGYLFEWPLNPYNNWEPMQIREVDGEFYPGDVMRELCPFSYTSDGVQISFELFVIGPSPEWAEPLSAIKGPNRAWVNPPEGTVFAIGYHAETDAEMNARREAHRAAAEESENEKQDQAEEQD